MSWNECVFGIFPAAAAGCPTSRSFFREMWDTAGLSLKPGGGSHRSTRVPHVRTSVRGPKTMGEALRQPFVPDLSLSLFIGSVVGDLRFVHPGRIEVREFLRC
jgi:hypothetical protein